MDIHCKKWQDHCSNYTDLQLQADLDNEEAKEDGEELSSAGGHVLSMLHTNKWGVIRCVAQTGHLGHMSTLGQIKLPPLLQNLDPSCHFTQPPGHDNSTI